uniref:T9SS type A sorting domain-containing protein n=1 Tax=Flavobacterium sp. TaxID=239 RepID=UPI00374D31B3
LTSTSNNNQTVASGTAIGTIVFTWGGTATDATVTGLPASGISFMKNISAKTITISGTPTVTVSYSIATTGTGTAATGSGTITVTTSNPSTNQIHNFTTSGKTSSFYTITGNMNSTAGSVTYNGLTLTERLKIESGTTITYTTTNSSTLTLVFDSNFTGTVKVNNVSYTASAGIVTASIPAGTNTISKGSVANLFYISTAYAGITLRTADFNETQIAEITKPVVYPNPVTNSLSISTKQNIEKVVIYNVSGMLVKTADKNTETIDVSNLTPGTYLVKVYTNNGSFNQTILKK